MGRRDDSLPQPQPGSRGNGMRKLSPVVLRAWTLPLIVAALALPITGAVLLGGPQAGLAAGAAVAATIVFLAVRAKYDEPIEVAPSEDERYHVLVVVTEAADDPRTAGAIAAAAARGTRQAGLEPEVLVLAPALNRSVAHWLSDLRGARMAAQKRLALSLASLAAARLDARGQVGDTDPVQAVEDTLASFPAQEVIFVTGSDQREDEIDELRRRLDRPLTHLVANGVEPSAARR